MQRNYGWVDKKIETNGEICVVKLLTHWVFFISHSMDLIRLIDSSIRFSFSGGILGDRWFSSMTMSSSLFSLSKHGAVRSLSMGSLDFMPGVCTCSPVELLLMQWEATLLRAENSWATERSLHRNTKIALITSTSKFSNRWYQTGWHNWKPAKDNIIRCGPQKQNNNNDNDSNKKGNTEKF